MRSESAPRGCPLDKAKARRDAENTGQIIRRRRGEIVEAVGKKSRGETVQPQKMLKMKIDPEMSMKTKDRGTICPTQKMTFLPGCTLFYIKIHEFLHTLSIFATIRALRTKPRGSECENSKVCASGSAPLRPKISHELSFSPHCGVRNAAVDSPPRLGRLPRSPARRRTGRHGGGK